jgi:pyruvate-ferredoxin/flavodoxin oxidoreductase
VLEETAAWLAANGGEKLGVLHVALYRPWDGDAFLAAMPKGVKAVAVLDRTKEVGALGDPRHYAPRAS